MLQADKTTQSGAELERENLLHGQEFVALDAGDFGRGERQSRLREAVEITGHQAVRCESDDPVARQIERFDILSLAALPR